MEEEQTIFVVDDDASARDSLRMLLEAYGFTIRDYLSAYDFLTDPLTKTGCLIADIRMPGMSGLELQEELNRRGVELPVIIVTGRGDIPLAVQAMKAGAADFIEKPFDDVHLVDSIRRALEVGKRKQSRAKEAKYARDIITMLTPREITVMEQLVRGNSNKIAAHELGISSRTIEIHRAHIMGKMKARSLSDVVRIALAAEQLV